MSQIEQVITQLRGLILAGKIKSGERLMEIPIAKDLGVSRTPVRIALGALELEGIVTSDGPKRGFYVRSFVLEDMFQAIELRGALEGIAARKLAERSAPIEIVNELKTCIAECEELLSIGVTTAERQQNWMRCNERFHAALISAPENTILSETIERLSNMPLVSPKAIPLIAGATEDQQLRLKRAHEDHQDIFEAIINRNGLRVEMLMREHASRNIKNKRANFWKMKSQANWNDLPGLNLVVPSD